MEIISVENWYTGLTDRQTDFKPKVPSYFARTVQKSNSLNKTNVITDFKRTQGVSISNFILKFQFILRNKFNNIKVSTHIVIYLYIDYTPVFITSFYNF